MREKHKSEEQKQQSVEYDCDKKPDQCRFSPVRLVRVDAASKPPHEEHDETDDGNSCNQNGEHPVTDRHHAARLISATLFNFCHKISRIRQFYWFGYCLRSEEHTSELQSRGHLVC